MIDWHSHILPGMDDGSRNVDDSLTMLKSLKDQGIRLVLATPHFSANAESVEEFRIRRKASYDRLFAHADADLPAVLCGAEVKYYPGISRMDSLEQLTIGDSRTLLLEMPFTKWTDSTVREVSELARMRRLNVVLAHIERYVAMQNRRIMDHLCENGLLLQVNADYFTRFGTRRKALKLLAEGRIHCIGSDCHNLTTRPPCSGEAYERIKRKFGEEFVSQMTHFGYQVLGQTMKTSVGYEETRI